MKTLEEKLKERYPNHNIELTKIVSHDFRPIIGITIDGKKMKTIWNVEDEQGRLAMTNKSIEEELENAFFAEIDKQLKG